MNRVLFRGRPYPLLPGESVLSGLRRGGVDIPYSCRSGSCHLCLLKATDGVLPARAQEGLRPARRALGFFLSCQCIPDGPLSVEPPDAVTETTARVVRLERPRPDLARLWVQPLAPLPHRAGQFVELGWPGHSLWRPYSIASVPELDDAIELHVDRIEGGALSPRLCDELRVGDELPLRGPGGECVYVEGRPEQPLVLAGTGSGLAPLVGIARDALARGHRGPLHPFHGARTRARLYAEADLLALVDRAPTLRYRALFLNDARADAPHLTRGRIQDAVLAAVRLLDQPRVFLCGDPSLVDLLAREVVLAGARPDDVFADAYTPAT